jgi:hypothetical protein
MATIGVTVNKPIFVIEAQVHDCESLQALTTSALKGR